MRKMTRRALGVAGIAVALTATTSLAQQPERVRIRGTLEKIDGQVLSVKSREGANVNVSMTNDVRPTAPVKASLEDLKPKNTYIGVTAMPQADGSQKAVAIHIFRESQRGVGEGFGPWDLTPGSTMTNAAVET